MPASQTVTAEGLQDLHRWIQDAFLGSSPENIPQWTPTAGVVPKQLLLAW